MEPEIIHMYLLMVQLSFLGYPSSFLLTTKETKALEVHVRENFDAMNYLITYLPASFCLHLLFQLLANQLELNQLQ